MPLTQHHHLEIDSTLVAYLAFMHPDATTVIFSHLFYLITDIAQRQCFTVFSRILITYPYGSKSNSRFAPEGVANITSLFFLLNSLA
jgi:hypothetical protein